MKRLPFVLNEWTRAIWIATPSTREIWDSRIKKIEIAWSDLEKLTVLDDIRDAAMLFLYPESIPALTKWAVTNDLLLLPMEQGGASTTYQAEAIEYKKGNPFRYRAILTKKKNVDLAYECTYPVQGDSDLIGKMLGFPECCREFFREYWTNQQYRDTSWPMAVRTNGPISDDVHEIDIKDMHLNCNILWHWMGLRLTMHLPCSFKCESTIKLVNDIIQCGHDHELVEQLDWLQEILSWPVEWSALHGIAEIKTPILKISARTDATADKYVIRYHGDQYPDEGATGVVFPYKKASCNSITDGKAFKKAFDVPLPPRIETTINVLPASKFPELLASVGTNTDEWLYNGFVSERAMDDAHDVLLEALRKNFPLTKEECSDTVLDLGCGNGILLNKICIQYEGLIPHGVEIDRDRFFSAYNLLGDTGEIAMGNISNFKLWPQSNYGLVVLMPRRIEELGEEGEAVRERLISITDTFLLYGYGDDIGDGLDKLNEHLGLSTDEWDFSETVQTYAASALLAVRKKS